MPETAEHVELQRRIASACTELTSLAHDKAKWSDDDKAQTDLDYIVEDCADAWDPDRTPSIFMLDVLGQFLRLCPVFELIKTSHDTADDEFHWSWVRCLLAGAGYEAHAELAEIGCALYPQCPLSPDETKDEWLKHLDTAHRTCGWPVTTIFLPWKPMFRALPYVEKGDYVPETWCRVLALLHTLKHTRVEFTAECPRFVVSFGGMSSFVAAKTNVGVLSEMREAVSALASMLNIPGSSNDKSQSPFRICWRAVTSRLTLSSFLPRRSLGSLPGFVLAGPWSCPVPAVDVPGFTQTGLRLDGVWIAKDGRISEYHGDDEDIITYAWNVQNASLFLADRTQFSNGLPSTYTVGRFPSDIWASYFKNLDESWMPTPAHCHAYRALVDSIIVASFLGDEFMGLQGEKPMLICFPKSPEVEHCTNQGKTTAALAITRAIVPGITQPVSMMTGASAPDQRSFAQQLLRYGTACIDEWVPTARDGHVLSNRNLQSAMTGGRLTIGLAGENAPGVSLRYSLTASCKAGDFPPDLVNRVIPCFLDALSEEAKSDESGEKLASGKASLEMRLAANHLIESTNIKDALRDAAKNSKTWRYPWHVVLAECIYEMRTGAKNPEVLKETILFMQERLRTHAQHAEESGLLTQLREGIHIELPLTSFFDNLTDMDIGQLVHMAEAHGTTIRGVRWITASALMRARKEAYGTNRAGALLEALTGLKATVTDRSLTRALLNSVRLKIGYGGIWDIPGTSYSVTRSMKEVEDAYEGKTWIRIIPRQRNEICPTL